MSGPPREILLSAFELTDRVEEVKSLSIDVIRCVARCEYTQKPCDKQARIKVKASDNRGVLIWHRVFCHEHAGLVLDEAPALGYWIVDD